LANRLLKSAGLAGAAGSRRWAARRRGQTVGMLDKVLLLGLVALPLPLSAQTAERPLTRLRYSRAAVPPDCPDQTELRDAVAGQLGYDPFWEDAPRTLSVQLASDEQLHAKLELRDGSGRLLGARLLTAERQDCRGLAAALVLAIDIAIDPLFRSRPRAPAAVPAPGPGSPTPAIVVAPPASAPATGGSAPPRGAISSPAAAARRGVNLRASVGVSAWLGAAPTVTMAVAAQLGLRWRLFSCGLEGRVDLPSQTQTAEVGSVQTQLLLGMLVPCLHYRFLAACALLSLGALRGEGVEVAQPRQQTTLYSSAGLRLAAELRLVKSVHLRPHLDLLGVLTRTELRVGDTQVWSTPPVAGAVGLDVMASFL
jgi:hypothetical protein